MPRLTTACPEGRGGRGLGRDWAREWMERRKEDGEREPRCQQPQRSSQPPADAQSQRRSWSQTLRAGNPWRGWLTVALVGVVWSVCQVEAPLHPSLCLVEVCWRLLLVCMLFIVLGGCVHALKCRLRLRQAEGETPQRMRREVLTEHTNNQYSWVSGARPPGPRVPLALALTDSLLLCVLQEPLPDPSLPHIQALLSRLESVSHTLGRADVGSEAKLEEANGDGDSTLTDKVKLVSSYLQQRTRSLRGLVGTQGELEAGVRDTLEGLDRLWARLEELHTGVTLTKEGSRGHRDLDTAQTEAETLFAVLGRYRGKLQVCQAHLRDSTQLLQELTWSHTHISHSVSSSSESVWPELLLQCNIEQFDKVQESFLSLEQQTSTFQAHLEGLGGGIQEGHAGPLSLPAGAPCSCSVSPQTAPSLCAAHPADVSQEDHDTSPASMSVSLDADAPLTLCERSALQFSTAFGRLRRSGRRK
uniref:uncharacterized protein isoform X1 n=1 Tax=Centroberyx gerrardi TaxID=166262 RepID=UPI003AB056F3